MHTRNIEFCSSTQVRYFREMHAEAIPIAIRAAATASKKPRPTKNSAPDTTQADKPQLPHPLQQQTVPSHNHEHARNAPQGVAKGTLGGGGGDSGGGTSRTNTSGSSAGNSVALSPKADILSSHSYSFLVRAGSGERCEIGEVEGGNMRRKSAPVYTTEPPSTLSPEKASPTSPGLSLQSQSQRQSHSQSQNSGSRRSLQMQLGVPGVSGLVRGGGGGIGVLLDNISFEIKHLVEKGAARASGKVWLVRAHTYIHTCIHTYIRTYIHTYMHAYIHTYSMIDTCHFLFFFVS